jgi:hypothetical protein
MITAFTIKSSMICQKKIMIKNKNYIKTNKNLLSYQQSSYKLAASMSSGDDTTSPAPLPNVAFYTIGLLIPCLCIGVGHLIGRRFGPTGQIMSTSIAVTLGVATTFVLKNRRDNFALCKIKDKISSMEDPSKIDPEYVQRVSDEFGVNITVRYSKQLRSIYDSYISNILPMDKSLTGNEVESIKRFKSSLGIRDEDAADVHIEIGRRINRLKSEAGCKTNTAKATKLLHRFIYVSTQVFGDLAFSLHWKRHLGISDAQMFIAKKTVQLNYLEKGFLDTVKKDYVLMKKFLTISGHIRKKYLFLLNLQQK